MFGRRRRQPWSADAPEGSMLRQFEAVMDDQDLEAMLESVSAETATSTQQLILSRLQPLVRRRIPVRHVEAAPLLHAVRIRFADGTTVLARGDKPGSAALLGAAILRGSVTMHCSIDDRGTRLDFTWNGAHRPLSVHVAGLDQPD